MVEKVRDGFLLSVDAVMDTLDHIAAAVEKGSRGSSRAAASLLQQLLQLRLSPLAAEVLVSSAKTLQCTLQSLFRAQVAFYLSYLDKGESAVLALQHS